MSQVFCHDVVEFTDTCIMNMLFVLIIWLSTYLFFLIFQLICIASYHLKNTFQGDSWPVISGTHQQSVFTERIDSSWRSGQPAFQHSAPCFEQTLLQSEYGMEIGWEGTGL